MAYIGFGTVAAPPQWLGAVTTAIKIGSDLYKKKREKDAEDRAKRRAAEASIKEANMQTPKDSMNQTATTPLKNGDATSTSFPFSTTTLLIGGVLLVVLVAVRR